MGSSPSPNISSSAPPTMAAVALLLLVGVSVTAAVSARNFSQDFDTWGDGRAQILNNGELLTLSLDQVSGSGFQSKNEYLFGNIDMQLRLIAGNSAGTVTTYFLSSNESTGSTRDEIEFGFLGNLSGEPYIVYTNVMTHGQGDREQQFYLWFDPTADFHTYSLLWNPQRIIFAIDGSPIRVFKNLEASMGVPYPKNQAMRVQGTVQSGKEWGLQGPANWTEAPFSASYRNFDAAESCVWSNGTSSCNSSLSHWLNDQLDSAGQARLRYVQNNYMIYNYCSDLDRFPRGQPPECDSS